MGIYDKFVLFKDNHQSAMYLGHTDDNKQIKNVDIRHHHINEWYNNNLIEAKYVQVNFKRLIFELNVFSVPCSTEIRNMLILK